VAAEWLALPSQVVSAVTGTDQAVRPGIEGLRYLADLGSEAGQRPNCSFNFYYVTDIK